MQQKEREEPVNQAEFRKPVQSVKETCDQLCQRTLAVQALLLAPSQMQIHFLRTSLE